ncbi:MAG: conditioned medium factor [Acidobacteria bacterium]|nr:conditioned medium factor [Acidobacteriota bacterium]
MRISMKVFLCMLVAATAVTAFGQKTRATTANEFKQLAGAADEIASLRLPNPAETGLSSKSAMLPIREGFQSIDIPVETAENFQVMIIARNGEMFDVKATLPGGERLNPRLESAFAERTETTYGLGGTSYPAEVFKFGKLGSGILRLEIETPKDGLAGDSTVGYLVSSSDSPYRLYSFVNTNQTVKGREIGVVARMYDVSTGDLRASSGTIANSQIEIRTPSGAIAKFDMFDDGAHADGLAGDGTFAGVFVPRESGNFILQVATTGRTGTGEGFLRTGEHVINVAESGAEFSGDAFVRPSDESRFAIDLPVAGLRSGQKVIAYAEVWGQDSESAVAWIGGMTIVKRGFSARQSIVPVSVDARWLARSGEKGGYELRNVRLQDADGTVTLGTAGRILLPEIKIPESLKSSYFGEITDDMRTGKRPAVTVDNAVGGKLMLIHGYCSGGNTFPASQFSNNIVFNDPNQNRTHDQFANLIKNFGAAYPSFGAVAHSQGGAATLHLYTYYWSGLDYATGPGTRLIQSVGTPYQGTALAGNLALLGQIFGAGCGSNTNLSYSGAASWLAGIPSSARAKVFYHTTSFTDVWWRYDYCNLATDPFLSDPEDGVVERSYAQLSGANNLGHKTGWCHTSGMRDPAQTGDSSRNSNMNSNAMR